MLPASLPRRLDLDGLSKSQIDRLLDVDGLTSLDEERMLELAGVDKEDFCEWAAARAGMPEAHRMGPGAGVSVGGISARPRVG